jgi:sporadic carbohydrate cluster protein (TIGR04323 family)
MTDGAKPQVRGYIFSRPFMGERAPQHVQNIVIRDCCERNDLRYLLSATEYVMPDCHLILRQVLDELQSIDAIALYSLFQLPQDAADRERVYSRVLSLGKTLYFAVESLKMSTEAERDRVEMIWQVRGTLPHCVISTQDAAPQIFEGLV